MISKKTNIIHVTMEIMITSTTTDDLELAQRISIEIHFQNTISVT
jgi:hypothetical protein